MIAVVLLAGCEEKIVDLGIDAPIDAPSEDAETTTCRCRIPRCASAADCALTGGVCGPDLFCVGDFGACSVDGDCRATGPATAICAQSTTSTVACE
jgi:hypothetical protein